MSEYIEPAPSDWLHIGNYRYELSSEILNYLKPDFKTTYPAKHHVLIIEDPHDSQLGQYELFCGLSWLFNDYPKLAEDTLFLAEGKPAGKKISVKKLLKTNITPSNDMIRDLLGTFSIPGYVAYEWVYQKGIPIEGAEDDARYIISETLLDRLYRQGAANLDEEEVKKLWAWKQWLFSVVIRNKMLASSIYNKLEQGWTNPILFVGGLHLYRMSPQTFINIRDTGQYGILGPFNEFSNAVAKYNPEDDSHGIYDLLKQWNIGFTFITIKNPLSTIVNVQQYVDTFADQAGFPRNNAKYLVDPAAFKYQGDNFVKSTTVRPNTHNAAAAARYIEKSNTIFYKPYEYYENDWFKRDSSEVKERLGRDSLWDNPSPTGRGWDYETLVGANIGRRNHPVVDDIIVVGSIATSMKTINVWDKTYNNPEEIFNTGIRYINDYFSDKFLNRNIPTPDGGFISPNSLEARNLEIGVPSFINNSQVEQLYRIQNYGAERNIRVIICKVD